MYDDDESCNQTRHICNRSSNNFFYFTFNLNLALFSWTLDHSNISTKLCFLRAFPSLNTKRNIHLIFSIIPASFPKRFLCLLASQSTGYLLSLLGEGVTQKHSNKLAIIQQWVSPKVFIIQMTGLSWSCSGRQLIHTRRVREIIASVRWTLQRGRLLFSSDPKSQDHSLISDPPIVHIQAFFSAAAHHSKPPTPPLNWCISPINPLRNVALVMERMPGVCPAGAVASRRTGACRSASHVWTVDSSTASRRATAPPPVMQCVATVCQGETCSNKQLVINENN